MKFKLYIDCDNAAFDNNDGTEIARILRVIAEAVENHGLPAMYQNIYDANGNKTGSYALKDE